MNEAEAVAFAVAIGAGLLVPLHYDGVIGNQGDVGEVARAAAAAGLSVMIPARGDALTFQARASPRAGRPAASGDGPAGRKA